MAFVVGAVYLPQAHEPFATVSLPAAQALTAFALAEVPALVIEIAKTAARHRRRDR